MTNLHDCFEFVQETGAIFLKGTRIEWEQVIQQFQNGMAAEEIASHFAAPLPLELVYAAITYYLMNKQEYAAYIRRGDELARQGFERYWASLSDEQRGKQSEMRQRLRDLKNRFTTDHGQLDIEALKAHTGGQKSQQTEAGV